MVTYIGLVIIYIKIKILFFKISMMTHIDLKKIAYNVEFSAACDANDVVRNAFGAEP